MDLRFAVVLGSVRGASHAAAISAAAVTERLLVARGVASFPPRVGTRTPGER